MRFASTITHAVKSDQALRELLGPLDERVTPGMVDLALLFVTPHFNEELPRVLQAVSGAVPNAILLGCTAEGTIGVGCELERIPSMSLLVGCLPDVTIRPFHVRQHDVETSESALDWERMVAVAPENHPAFIALGDPFSIAIHDWVEQMNTAYPGSPIVGGVASGARQPRQNRLIVGGEVYREGLVGAALTGEFDLSFVVSQGCRPIGKPFVITKGDRNVIHELGGVAALEQLHTVLSTLPDEDAQLARQSLFVGRVIDEYKGHFSRGDFLIHNIIGVDRNRGLLGIAGHARVGATVQFHVRDAQSADEDLRAMLAPHAAQPPDGAILFGCNGRGSNMWPQPGHDAGVFREILGDVPLTGFFCAGEIGPVGGRNFVHGFTASIALFRGTEESEAEGSEESRTVD